MKRLLVVLAALAWVPGEPVQSAFTADLAVAVLSEGEHAQREATVQR